MILEKHKK